jgi:hypothetical protein
MFAQTALLLVLVSPLQAFAPVLNPPNVPVTAGQTESDIIILPRLPKDLGKCNDRGIGDIRCDSTQIRWYCSQYSWVPSPCPTSLKCKEKLRKGKVRAICVPENEGKDYIECTTKSGSGSMRCSGAGTREMCVKGTWKPKPCPKEYTCKQFSIARDAACVAGQLLQDIVKHAGKKPSEISVELKTEGYMLRKANLGKKP